VSEEVYSPGLEGVVAGETAVSTLAGGLQYRGYAVEELAQHATFEEVAYLLLHGELPSQAELKAFQERLTDAMTVPPEVIATLKSIPREASLMDVMRSGASLLAHWDLETGDNSHAANVRKAERPRGNDCSKAKSRSPAMPIVHWPPIFSGCSRGWNPASGRSRRWTSR